MANWVRDFQGQNPGVEIVKRARCSIHVRGDGPRSRIGYFTGAPCHYEAAPGDWQPLDTERQIRAADDYPGDAADGYIYGQSPVYATARGTSSLYDSLSTNLAIGQRNIAGTYRVYRGFLKFDTSAIPDGDTITQVNLRLVCTTDSSAADFDVQIVKQDWSAQDPLLNANREAAFDNCLAGAADDSIWRNTNGMALNTQYTSGNLATAWPSKTGNTYYSLRSNRDLGGNAPVGLEYIILASANHATVAFRPVLVVAYVAASSGGAMSGLSGLSGMVAWWQ